jgi:hypothetical protein
LPKSATTATTNLRICWVVNKWMLADRLGVLVDAE